MNDTQLNFVVLFEGNPNALGTNEGGCFRVAGYPEWQRAVINHLNGLGPPVGVYPMFEVDGEWKVTWGCIDIDFDDEQLAWNLHAVLAAMGITAWVERSRSKGYHVWVFADGWVPPRVMQHALRAACQIAEYEPKEVNPKQLTLTPSQLGNYVRLPYPHGYEHRQVMLDPDRASEYTLSGFVEEAEATRASIETLDDAAALYVPPAPPKPIQWDKPAGGSDAVSKLPGLAYTIYRDGPLQGQDRSTTLFRLAAKSFEAGLTGGEVLDLMVDADNRWGKFSGRSDQVAQLTKIIERAT